MFPALQHEFSGAIDLIYIDPPFMTGRTFSSGTQVAYSDTWNNDQDSYLQWLYETLHLLYTLLAFDGSLYIHLDWRATHHAKTHAGRNLRLSTPDWKVQGSKMKSSGTINQVDVQKSISRVNMIVSYSTQNQGNTAFIVREWASAGEARNVITCERR